MRFSLSWLQELVDLPAGVDAELLAADLASIGLEEEGLLRSEVSGPVTVGRVLSVTPEEHSNGKTVNWCQVDVGEAEPRGIVCGAHNFGVGDLVVATLPGAVLPGDFRIAARKTYGHVSDGMIASARELGLGDDHEGIIVLSRFGLEAEPGDDAIALLGIDDIGLDVNVTPDRGYQLSMRGLAREAAAVYDSAFTDPAQGVAAPSPGQHGFPIELADRGPIDEVPGCDAFAAIEVTGVDPTAITPHHVQRRLQQAGMRPISLAVDATNYVMLLLGQPLHAYDRALLGEKIVVRRAEVGEKLTTLDDVVRTLDPEDLLITDVQGGSSRLIGLAGVMGGAELEVTPSTTSVLIEAAHFDPVSVARTARRHRLSSEAGRRFERGVDPVLGPIAARLCAELLVAWGGGSISEDATVIAAESTPPVLTISAGACSAYIGVDYAPERAASLLARIGADVVQDSDALIVTVPSWRPDLVGDVHLYEEIARIGGYDEIPALLPPAPGGRGLTDLQRGRRRVSDLLADDGWTEVLTYPFTSAARMDALRLDADDPRRAALRLANPMAEDAPLLRTTLLSTLADAIVRNLGRGAKDVRVFEVGLVTRPGENFDPRGGTYDPGYHPSAAELAQIWEAVPAQPRHVAGVIAGHAELPGVWGPGRAVEAGDVIEQVRRIAAIRQVPLTVSATRIAPYHPGRAAEFALADGTVIGEAGELHPKVCENLGLPPRTAAFELDLDALLAQDPVRRWDGALSTYPVSRQDAALIVDAGLPAADLEAVLRSACGELLEHLELFDSYTGDQVGEGRTSLAYRFTFRAADRTLRAEEASELREAAVAAAREAFGAQARG